MKWPIPVWFQSLGTLLAFDWNASGITTVLIGALKEAIKEQEEDLGIFICGGKGKTSGGSKGDLKVGEKVMAFGASNSDGSILLKAFS